MEKAVELFQVPLAGQAVQLTHSRAGTLHYHPQPSRDGNWLVYGSKRDGVRNLFVMNLANRSEQPLTQLPRGSAAMWPHWQPRALPGHQNER